MTEPNENYVDLSDLISFAGFRYVDYINGEKEILQPQMEALGYTNIQWLPGETDSFGPLTRVCRATSPTGKAVISFIYG
jgi:hypothetical protein